MYSAIIIGLILLNWLLVYVININVGRDLVVLHYNVDSGVNLVGNAGQVYIIPLTGVVVFAINFILSAFIGRRERTISHLLLGSAALVNLFLLIAAASVYLVNFYR